MEKKANSVIPVLAGSILMLGLAAGAASAQASDYCGASSACLYDNDNYTAKLVEAGWIGRTTLASNLQNKASSWRNNRGSNGAVYDTTTGTGLCSTISAYDQGKWTWGVFPHDRVKSWRTDRGC